MFCSKDMLKHGQEDLGIELTYPLISGQPLLPPEPHSLFGLIAKHSWPSKQTGTANHLAHTVLTSHCMDLCTNKEIRIRKEQWIKLNKEISSEGKEVLPNATLGTGTTIHLSSWRATAPSQAALGQSSECPSMAPAKAQTWTPLRPEDTSLPMILIQSDRGQEDLKWKRHNRKNWKLKELLLALGVLWIQPPILLFKQK